MTEGVVAADTATVPLSPWRTGLLLASSVLGVGLLLSPAITAGLAGGRAWLAWSVHLLTGGLLSVAIGLRARRLGSGRGVSELVGAACGAAGARGVTALYLAGFIVGQAAIAQAAGRFTAYAVVRSDAGGIVVAAAVVAVLVAAATAAAGPAVPPRLRYWRVGVALAVGLALAADPVLLRGTGLLPAGGSRQFWPAVFLLLFAGVGWEQSAGLAARVRGTRELGRALAFGAAVISGTYLLVGTIAASAGRGESAPWSTGVSATVAGVVAVLLASFCLTNIRTAAGFVATLAPDWPLGRVGRVALVATAVLVVLAVGAGGGWRTHHLLAGPAVATWLIYALVSRCGARRCGGTMALAFAVPAALLFVTAAATMWSVGP